MDGVSFGSKFIQKYLKLFRKNPVLSTAHVQLFYILFLYGPNRIILRVMIISFGLVSL